MIKILKCLFVVSVLLSMSCNEHADVTENLQEDNRACLVKSDYEKSLVNFTCNHKFDAIVKDGKKMAPDQQHNDNNEITSIPYVVGEYVGDPNDEVIAADGYIIKAANEQVEADAKLVLQEEITKARNFLFSQGLDFSDVYSSDDYRYIHAANIVIEMANTVGIPGNIDIISGGGRTVGGCVLEAFGIKELCTIWYGKFATKRMLIKLVGKIAARYFGYVGAALSMYAFVDCMWGGTKMEEIKLYPESDTGKKIVDLPPIFNH